MSVIVFFDVQSSEERITYLFLSPSLSHHSLRLQNPILSLLERDFELLGWGSTSVDVLRRPLGGALQGSSGSSGRR